jgi:heme/copper-type cytochrome/quinol oxidase subunit 2
MKRIIIAVLASSFLIICGAIAKLENWEHYNLLLMAGIISWVITLVLIVIHLRSKIRKR